jgi:hypothetical protein
VDKQTPVGILVDDLFFKQSINFEFERRTLFAFAWGSMKALTFWLKKWENNQHSATARVMQL